MGEFSSTSPQRICKKCLLEEANEEAYKAVARELERMSDKLRVNDDVYRARLDVCMSCDKLVGGSWMACGCYVELRAAAVTARCPKKKW
ncbi:MAG: DUF6171 family protein [Lachnospiraceae bacterium]|nr:DUF6171 family protein [Lachnospiraceae bacterium]